jgi:hypothetical protein
MLKIQKNSSNNLVVTVTEKTTIDPAYYLLALRSNDNMNTTVVRLSGNTSPNIERYDKFILDEVSLANQYLENAKINLEAGSTYDYSIYQTPLTSGTSISGLTIVETGLLKVSNPTITATTFNSPKTIITFE